MKHRRRSVVTDPPIVEELVTQHIDGLFTGNSAEIISAQDYMDMSFGQSLRLDMTSTAMGASLRSTAPFYLESTNAVSTLKNPTSLMARQALAQYRRQHEQNVRDHYLRQCVWGVLVHQSQFAKFVDRVVHQRRAATVIRLKAVPLMKAFVYKLRKRMWLQQEKGMNPSMPIQILRRDALFHTLPDSDLVRLASKWHLQVARKGHLMRHKGTYVTDAFCVVKGTVIAVVNTSSSSNHYSSSNKSVSDSFSSVYASPGSPSFNKGVKDVTSFPDGGNVISPNVCIDIVAMYMAERSLATFEIKADAVYWEMTLQSFEEFLQESDAIVVSTIRTAARGMHEENIPTHFPLTPLWLIDFDVFSSFRLQQLEEMLDHAVPRYFQAGDLLCDAGVGLAPSMFLLMNGTVDVSLVPDSPKNGGGGITTPTKQRHRMSILSSQVGLHRESMNIGHRRTSLTMNELSKLNSVVDTRSGVLGTITAPAIIGHIGLLFLERREAQVRAETGCECYEIRRSDFMHFMLQRPDVLLDIKKRANEIRAEWLPSPTKAQIQSFLSLVFPQKLVHAFEYGHLLRFLTPRIYDKTEVLVTKGQPSANVVFITEGQVEVISAIYPTPPGYPSCVGASYEVYHQIPAQCTVKALTHVEAYLCPAEKWLRFFEIQRQDIGLLAAACMKVPAILLTPSGNNAIDPKGGGGGDLVTKTMSKPNTSKQNSNNKYGFRRTVRGGGKPPEQSGVLDSTSSSLQPPPPINDSSFLFSSVLQQSNSTVSLFKQPPGEGGGEGEPTEDTDETSLASPARRGPMDIALMLRMKKFRDIPVPDPIPKLLAPQKPPPGPSINVQSFITTYKHPPPPSAPKDVLIGQDPSQLPLLHANRLNTANTTVRVLPSRRQASRGGGGSQYQYGGGQFYVPPPPPSQSSALAALRGKSQQQQQQQQSNQYLTSTLWTSGTSHHSGSGTKQSSHVVVLPQPRFAASMALWKESQKM